MNLVFNELPKLPDPGCDTSGMTGRAAANSPAPTVAGGAAPLIEKLKQRPADERFLRADEFRRDLARDGRRDARIALCALVVMIAVGAILTNAFLTAIINAGGQ